jgi:hypothetical protein
LFVPFAEYDKETGVVAPDAGSDVEDAGCDANFSTDKENCGACGHKCLGANCIVGLCQPQLTMQIPNTVPIGLASDGEYLYASFGVGDNPDKIESAIARVQKTNLANLQIIAVPLGPNTLRIAVDESRVFWTQGAFAEDRDSGPPPRGVASASKLPDGGPHLGVMLAPNQRNPYAIAIDGTRVYWANYPDGNDVWGAAKTGAGARSLATLQFASSLAVDEEYLYWPQLLPSGSIMRASKDGGLQQPVAENQDVPMSITVDETHVYWGTRGASGIGSIFRAPKSGGPPEELARQQQSPTVLVARGDHIYWMNANQGTQSDGMILRAPKAGGRALILAVNLKPYDMAVDDTHVYWSSTEGVFRVPR